MRQSLSSEEHIRLMIARTIKNSTYGVYANMEMLEDKTKKLIIDLEYDHPVVYDVGIPARMRPVKYGMIDCVAALVGIKPQVYRNDDIINLRGFNLKKLNLNQTADTGIADVIWDYRHSTIMDKPLRTDDGFNIVVSDNIIDILKSKREYSLWQRKMMYNRLS